jgi:hypothetical protein
MQLRLRLAFNQRKAGLLRFRPGSMDVQLSDGLNEPIVLEYAHSGAFLDQLGEADVTDTARAQIVRAITISSMSPGKPSCCEDIALSDRQVLFLLAGADRTRAA